MICNAHACRMEGTISAANGEGAMFYCRFHYAKTAAESSVITGRISKNYELIMAAETIRYGHKDFDAVARKVDRSDLCATVKQNKSGEEVDERLFNGFHYCRVMNTLVREIKDGVS